LKAKVKMLNVKAIAKTTAILIAVIVILVAGLIGTIIYFTSQPGEEQPPTPSFVTENKLVYESGATYQWVWYNRESTTDIIPWLAESWTEINNTCYEFKLREGITFQDGTPFNATAVWFSFNRLLIIDGTDGSGNHGTQAAWILEQLVDPDGEIFAGMGAEPA